MRVVGVVILVLPYGLAASVVFNYNRNLTPFDYYTNEFLRRYHSIHGGGLYYTSLAPHFRHIQFVFFGIMGVYSVAQLVSGFCAHKILC